jgi:glycosyltransferase involved in cell wall biosynthesis
MSIAYIYDAVYPWIKGGAEKRVFELSRRLAARGHDVHCYGIKWWEGEKTIVQEDVHIHGILSPINLYSGDRRSIKEAVWFASKLLSSFSQRFDVVDCQEFPYIPCFSAKLSTKMRGGELFITWHEVWGDYWHNYLGDIGFVGFWIEKATSKLTGNNIAVSEMTRRDLEAIGVQKVRVVPNGVDFRGIDRLKASEMNSDIIYVGRLVEHKNLDILIRALALVKDVRQDIRAIIIGDGPERERLQIQSKQLNLEKNLIFTGFIEKYDEALALMKSSKIFVSPSMREGFGMAALEAKACGLPLITFKHRMNAVCDLIDKTDLICELGDNDLAGAILSLLDKQQNVRSRCKEFAKSYDWEKVCDLVEEVYAARAES